MQLACTRHGGSSHSEAKASAKEQAEEFQAGNGLVCT